MKPRAPSGVRERGQSGSRPLAKSQSYSKYVIQPPPRTLPDSNEKEIKSVAFNIPQKTKAMTPLEHLQ
jgi:hypothetical protein